MQAINPTTEQLIGDYAEHDQAHVERLLEAAAAAWGSWREKPIGDRAKLMRGVARVLRHRSAELSALMTREMGKPIAQSEAEIEKCAVCCDHFAEHAAGYLAERMIESDADQSLVRFDPLGA